MILKKQMKAKVLYSILSILAAIMMWATPMVQAESHLPNDWKVFSERVDEYQQPVAGETTVQMVKNLFLKNVVPIGRYLMIGVSILIFGYYAYQITIGPGKDDQWSSAQQNIIYAVLGFAIIGGADILVSVVDPLQVADTTKPFDQSKAEYAMRRIVNFMEVPLGAIAIMLIFFGGFKMIAQAGDKDAVKFGKNFISYGFLGFVFVMLAEPLVNLIFYPNNGLSGVGTPQAQQFILEGFGLLRFVFVFFGVATFIVFLYAAFLYITSADSDDGSKKAKEAFKWAVIGLFVILISYSIVMFFIPASAV